MLVLSPMLAAFEPTPLSEMTLPVMVFAVPPVRETPLTPLEEMTLPVMVFAVPPVREMPLEELPKRVPPGFETDRVAFDQVAGGGLPADAIAAVARGIRVHPGPVPPIVLFTALARPMPPLKLGKGL